MKRGGRPKNPEGSMRRMVMLPLYPADALRLAEVMSYMETDPTFLGAVTKAGALRYALAIVANQIRETHGESVNE